MVLVAPPDQAATVLVHVARRFHYEIGDLTTGDICSYITNRVVVAPFESNYLSGTAIAIRPGYYPAGSAGNLFPTELVVVRDILAECEGVVRWGGDDRSCPKESHFQIDVPPNDPALKRVAAKIAGWNAKPGRGAGVLIDPLTTERRGAAATLGRRQRR